VGSAFTALKNKQTHFSEEAADKFKNLQHLKADAHKTGNFKHTYWYK
jgi:hypothetical protein